MRARLIVNPTATTTNNGVRDALAGLLGTGLELTVVGTRARLHAVSLARDAVADGVDAVFVLGGDGTANEVLQGVAGTDVALGILPGGGTNVLARAIGLPRDAELAATQQLEALHRDHDDRLGLGEVNGRFFGFQAGLGLDASIVARVEDHPGMKRWLRQLSFVALGLREWATSEDRSDPAVHLDGHDTGPGMLIAVANLEPYTYLGPRPFRLVPNSGQGTALDALLVEQQSTPRVLRAVLKAFIDASHVDEPGFHLVQGLDEFTVRTHRPVPLMTDGDTVTTVQEAAFRHRPGHLRVLATLDASADDEASGRQGRAA